MELLWFAPVAFAGLALLVAPIAIHLLTRRERRPVPFPSLRFLRTARLAALTRRAVDDWPLLLIRLGIVAAAVLALAGPLLITDARRASWGNRIVRAIVATADGDVSGEEVTSAFRSATFTADTERLANTISAALSWLESQPFAAREIVIAGDLRASMLSGADLAQVPPHIGVRFLVRTPRDSRRDLAIPLLVRGPAGAAATELRLRLEEGRTRVVGSHALPNDTALALQVRAAPEEQSVADAALWAVLQEGVVLDHARARRVVVAWQGADVSDLVSPPESGSERDPYAGSTPGWLNPVLERLQYSARFVRGTLLVAIDRQATDESAAVALESIARAVFSGANVPLEPQPVADADLRAWTRPSGRVPSSARPQDEGDRRAVWGLALLLMCIEQVWRRGRSRNRTLSTELTSEGARVA